MKAKKRFANNTEQHVQVVNFQIDKTKRLSWCPITKLHLLSNCKLATHDFDSCKGKNKT